MRRESKIKNFLRPPLRAVVWLWVPKQLTYEHDKEPAPSPIDDGQNKEKNLSAQGRKEKDAAEVSKRRQEEQQQACAPAT